MLCTYVHACIVCVCVSILCRCPLIDVFIRIAGVKWILTDIQMGGNMKQKVHVGLDSVLSEYYVLLTPQPIVS